MDNNQEKVPKIKRGRGRPRKTPKPEVPPSAPEPEPMPARASTPMPPPPREYHNEIEELLIPRTTVDTSDIARAMAPPPEPTRAAPDEDEVIRLPTMEDEVAAPRGNLPPPPIVLTSPPPEDAARRRAVLSRIRKYRESFDAVRAMKFDEEWSTEKLEAHLEDIRIAVGSKSSTVLVKHTYLAGVRGLEMATCAMGLKTYGLVSVLSANAEVDCALKQLAAEIGIGSVPPGHRLAIATIGAVLALDSANRRNETLSSFKKESVNENISMKYADL